MLDAELLNVVQIVQSLEQVVKHEVQIVSSMTGRDSSPAAMSYIRSLELAERQLDAAKVALLGVAECRRALAPARKLEEGEIDRG